MHFISGTSYCKLCKAPFEKTGTRQIYCPACRKQNQKKTPSFYHNRVIKQAVVIERVNQCWKCHRPPSPDMVVKEWIDQDGVRWFCCECCRGDSQLWFVTEVKDGRVERRTVRGTDETILEGEMVWTE